MDRRTFHKLFAVFFAGLFVPGTIARSAEPGLPSSKPDQRKREESSNINGPLVIRVQSERAISGPDDSPDPAILSAMFEKGLTSLTATSNAGVAWLKLLSGYKKGDRVAIKPNFNNLRNRSQYSITSPHLINVIVKQLVEQAGVAPENISIYDLCKKIPHDVVRSKIEYPVEYVEGGDADTIIDKFRLRLRQGPASADTQAEIEMREPIIDEQGRPVKCYVPKVVTRAEHLINMPLLTNHIFILNSGALKNHFGTVRFSNFNSYPVALHGPVLNKSVSDINRNHHIRKKTRLIIADGLFGIYDRGEGNGRKAWKTFSDDYPKSIFLSTDPVAVDSVMASVLARERISRRFKVLSPEYLRDAAQEGLGVYEFTSGLQKFSKISYQEISV